MSDEDIWEPPSAAGLKRPLLDAIREEQYVASHPVNIGEQQSIASSELPMSMSAEETTVPFASAFEPHSAHEPAGWHHASDGDIAALVTTPDISHAATAPSGLDVHDSATPIFITSGHAGDGNGGPNRLEERHDTHAEVLRQAVAGQDAGMHKAFGTQPSS